MIHYCMFSADGMSIQYIQRVIVREAFKENKIKYPAIDETLVLRLLPAFWRFTKGRMKFHQPFFERFSQFITHGRHKALQ